MGKGLTAAQRRAVTGSDPSTGRVTARGEVCTGLAAAGLAVRHARSGQFYLTPEGRRVRAELSAAAAPAPSDSSSAPDPERTEVGAGRGQFVADDGSGAAPAAAGRAAEVAAAWEGLRQIRAVLGDGAVEVPAAWERERPVHAVALALEAAGVPPHRGGPAGYRVAPAGHPGLVEVTWSATGSGPAALARVAALLGPRGWQATEHRTRGGDPYLLVSPRHA
ncbi:hypothetical protein [Actinacidiphila yanglinensis]|uniref:hypothetical protein n=1 Tax=Actinacidiphila yanglinensis TaxID=310779 RepID=UPI000CDEE531|nr:hypothetical protein [Actinacidiphila yanglinensis]